MTLLRRAFLVTTAAALAVGQNVSVVRNTLITDITSQLPSGTAASNTIQFGGTGAAGKMLLAFDGKNQIIYVKPKAAATYVRLVGDGDPGL